MPAPENPLLASSSRFDGAIPFDQVREEHFAPALTTALDAARARLAAIAADPAPPTFANVVDAIEHHGAELDAVQKVFGALLHTDTTPGLQALAREVRPKIASHWNDLYLSAALFGRVAAVHAQPPADLDAERRMVLENTYREFVRNGARLGADAQAELRRIDERLAVATQLFADNVLAATSAYARVVRDRAELDGLPASAVETAAAEAAERGHAPGVWVLTLKAPCLDAVLKHARVRALREELWHARATRATAGEHDNRPLMREIATLRHRRAVLLGYATHADYVLETRMASTRERVDAFLTRLLGVARGAAAGDLDDMRALSGLGAGFRPWDAAFWAERIREQRFALDEEALRAYFPLPRVRDGVFEIARRLWGLSFLPRPDLPTYHPEVEVFEVRDATDYLGLLYLDLHPRASKQAGAWQTELRAAGDCPLAGRTLRPHAQIVGNLTAPSAASPVALLTLQEVRTLFHEAGHALHALLTRCRYPSVACTNVWWDFVELPSQILENWGRHPDGLALYARHHETGAPLPPELVQRVVAAEQFQAGSALLRQLGFSRIDLAWHAGDPSGVTDVEAFEAAAQASTSLYAHEPGSVVGASFGHIFSGGYAAGYYSYKWAEVLDADAFELFLERGIFDAETARRFRSEILERGGSEHPAELYRRFRGRDPDPDALLRRDGLVAA